jgi:hypothetical protein
MNSLISEKLPQLYKGTESMCEFPHPLAFGITTSNGTPKLNGRTVLPIEKEMLESNVKLMLPFPNQFRSNREVYSVELETGTKCVWLPTRLWNENGGESDYGQNFRTEVLAYEIDSKFGFNLIPPTITRTINGRVGSLQLFDISRAVKGVRAKDGNSRKTVFIMDRSSSLNIQNGSSKNFVNNLQFEFDKKFFFDFLILNRDRAARWIVTSDAKVISFGNNETFVQCPDVPDPLTWFQSRIDGIYSFMRTKEGEQIVERLRCALTDAKFREDLQVYLGTHDTNGFFERMEYLVKYFDTFVSKENSIIRIE